MNSSLPRNKMFQAAHRSAEDLEHIFSILRQPIAPTNRWPCLCRASPLGEQGNRSKKSNEPDTPATLSAKRQRSINLSPNHIPYDSVSVQVPPTTLPNCRPHGSMSEAAQHSSRANPLLCQTAALVKQDNFTHYIPPLPPPAPICRQPSTCQAQSKHGTLPPIVYHVEASPSVT